MTLYDVLRVIVGPYVIQQEEMDYDTNFQPQSVEPIGQLKINEIGNANSPLGEIIPYLSRSVKTIKREPDKIIITVENY